MDWIWHVRLFSLFEMYLAVMFLLGLWLRYRQYRDVVALGAALPTRWPRVMKLITQHAHILWTWQTVLPMLLSLGLLIVQLCVRWYVFAGANLTIEETLNVWLVLPVVIVTALLMVGYDGWISTQVGEFDRTGIEKQLDEAEGWLRSWKAPVVRLLSFGFINPRGIVQKEVAGALVETSELLNRSMYSVALQAGLRLAFGAALWVTYLLLPA